MGPYFFALDRIEGAGAKAKGLLLFFQLSISISHRENIGQKVIGRNENSSAKKGAPIDQGKKLLSEFPPPRTRRIFACERSMQIAKFYIREKLTGGPK